MNLQWSAFPIIACLQLIGLPLDLKYQPKLSWTRIFICLFTFFINSSSNIATFYRIFVYSASNYYILMSSSATLAWNDVIDDLSYVLSTSGSLFSLLFVTIVNWSTLVKVFRQFERENCLLASKDYEKFRKICLAAVIYNLIVCNYNNKIFKILIEIFVHFFIGIRGYNHLFYYTTYTKFTCSISELLANGFLFITILWLHLYILPCNDVCMLGLDDQEYPEGFIHPSGAIRSAVNR